MGKKTRLFKKQSTTIRAINITITKTIIRTTIVHSYPDTNNTLYKMPLYEMIVTGTNDQGHIISKSFEILRFGIYTNISEGIYEKLIGLSNEQSYALQWINDLMDGVWQIQNDWLIIPGSPDPITEIWGATGCIEICGPNAWDDFMKLITQLTGSTDFNSIGMSKKITLTCTKAVSPKVEKQ